MLTTEYIREKAIQYGADLCGVADIALFDGDAPQRNPKSILPNAKCVVGFGFRVPRGLYDAMERKVQFMNYTSLGVKYMDEDFSEMFLLQMARIFENEGYDACLQRRVSNLRIAGDKTQNPEVRDTYELTLSSPVTEGKPAPEIIMDFDLAAQRCGLGCVSRMGKVITPRFGPYVRFVFLVTDAPLQPDEPFTEQLCDGCGACMEACPGHAIDENGRDTWQCSVYYRGAGKSNPLMREDFLLDDPEREDILSGAKRFDAESAREIYPKLDFLPSRPTGYVPCLCGKACETACMKHLEGRGILCRK